MLEILRPIFPFAYLFFWADIMIFIAYELFGLLKPL